jgi:hypothetical protein
MIKRLPGTLCLLILIITALSLNFSTVESAPQPILMSEMDNSGKYALLIGINKYTNEGVNPLKGAVADVLSMKNLLTSQKFGFPNNEEHVRVLTDEAATGDNILNAFRELIEKAKKYKNLTHEDATVFFHYSGHGSRSPVPTGTTKAEEPDGYDETIIPVDSRDAQNKHFDLRDDELGVLIKELTKQTKNVVYVFDSCHSGTINRGTDIAREAKADTRPQPAYNLSSFKPEPMTKSPKDKNEFLSGGNDYVLIAGTRSSNKSYEMEMPDGTSRGALSFYLERAMRDSSPNTTYLELMRRVRVEVNHHNADQEPQIVGDLTRRVMGGNFSGGEIPIPIVSVDSAKSTITIAAGKMLGIREGSILAVHDQNSAKIAEAVVKTVKNNEAEAEYSFIKQSSTGSGQIKIDPQTDVVTLLSPLFGAEPMQVFLDLTEKQNRSTTEIKADTVLANLAEKLKKSKLFQVETGTLEKNRTKVVKNANVQSVNIKRDTFREAFCGGVKTLNTTSEAKAEAENQCRSLMPLPKTDEKGIEIPLPQDDEDVFYLAQTGSGEPLYQWFVKVSDEKAAEKIEKTLIIFTRQKNVLSLQNKGSKTAEKIKIEFIEAGGGFDNGGVFIPDLDKDKVKALGKGLSYRLPLDAFYKLRITNTSNKELFITVLNLSNDGAINVMYPISEQSQQPLLPNTPTDTDVLQTSLPLGSENFKIIVTEQFSDYSQLVQGAVSKDARNSTNPLSSLMEQSVFGTRSTGVRKAPKTDEWGVAEISIEIVPK